MFKNLYILPCKYKQFPVTLSFKILHSQTTFTKLVRQIIWKCTRLDRENRQVMINATKKFATTLPGSIMKSKFQGLNRIRKKLDISQFQNAFFLLVRVCERGQHFFAEHLCSSTFSATGREKYCSSAADLVYASSLDWAMLESKSMQGFNFTSFCDVRTAFYKGTL